MLARLGKTSHRYQLTAVLLALVAATAACGGQNTVKVTHAAIVSHDQAAHSDTNGSKPPCQILSNQQLQQIIGPPPAGGYVVSQPDDRACSWNSNERQLTIFDGKSSDPVLTQLTSGASQTGSDPCTGGAHGALWHANTVAAATCQRGDEAWAAQVTSIPAMNGAAAEDPAALLGAAAEAVKML